ncbi:MAG: hypothetical protein ABI668_11330 [Sphingorhabdus sp.]
MLGIDPLGLDSVMLDEARAYLRLESGEEDAPLAAIILAAIGHAEGFIGQLVVRRGVRQILPSSATWQRLGAGPVQAVTVVTGIPAEGATFALMPSAYAVDIDINGDGHIRVMQPGSAGRVEVAYQAGLAAEWAELPEALRLGILRLTAHLHAHRDASDDSGPPAAVAVLLRPWRRVRF